MGYFADDLRERGMEDNAEVLASAAERSQQTLTEVGRSSGEADLAGHYLGLSLVTSCLDCHQNPSRCAQQAAGQIFLLGSS